MNGFLLDSNVVSEAIKPRPEPRVLSFVRSASEVWLSAIVLHELEFGIRRLEPGRRRTHMRTALDAYLARYAHRVLPVEDVEAVIAAAMRVEAQRAGRVLHVADALIAGTARAYGLTVVTRNVRDFEALDVDVLNPWDFR